MDEWPAQGRTDESGRLLRGQCMFVCDRFEWRVLTFSVQGDIAHLELKR